MLNIKRGAVYKNFNSCTQGPGSGVYIQISSLTNGMVTGKLIKISEFQYPYTQKQGQEWYFIGFL